MFARGVVFRSLIILIYRLIARKRCQRRGHESLHAREGTIYVKEARQVYACNAVNAVITIHEGERLPASGRARNLLRTAFSRVQNQPKHPLSVTGVRGGKGWRKTVLRHLLEKPRSLQQRALARSSPTDSICALRLSISI